MCTKRCAIGCFILQVALVTANADAAIQYVRADASPGGDGTSWASAYNTLQAALEVANPGDQIWVKKGVYYPADQSTPIDLTQNTTTLTVYGGFTGNETLLSQRNFVTNVTILSGDVGTIGYPGDNAFTVVIAPGATNATVFDGFTITGGNGSAGAGIYLVSQSSPTIRNCRIMGNIGGGMYCENRAAPLISDCTFDHNTATLGAAITFTTSTLASSPQIARCRFEANVASGSGGAISLIQSGNISTGVFGTLVVQDCVFIANESRGAGASGGGAVVLSTASHSRFIQCLFARNLSVRNGGAIWCSNTSPGTNYKSDTTLINCTFSGNAALFALGGGLRNESQTTVTTRNSLFWGNTGTDATLGSRQFSYAAAAPPTITYTSIQDYTSGLFPGTGNNGGDPKFVSVAADNLRVASGSSAIDSADNCVLDTGVASDLDGTGHARQLDDTITPDTGADCTLPPPPTPLFYLDRGVYEFNGSLDCNNNGQPDNTDLANGTSQDCNGNWKPDECDIASGFSQDCQALGQPGHGVPDECNIASGLSRDCNVNGIPDDCEFTDCNRNCIDDTTETDCNTNGIPDDCESADMVTWTTESDFNKGTRINLFEFGDQLVRLPANQTRPLPYIWVAASGRDTVVRVNTDTGAIEGEYFTGPEFHNGSSATMNPSRTTVDLDGSVWVANRDDISLVGGISRGSVVKIGLITGGTRSGQYLAPPFSYCGCEDRDGDGLIRTSSGLGDILPWKNFNSVDDDGGVEEAEDECILRYTRTLGTGTRTIALDK